MFRRLSTKWLVAVLATVVLPFLGFAWYVDGALARRLSWDVVRYYLLSLAADLAERVDLEVRRNRETVELLAAQTMLAWALDEEPQERRALVLGVEQELEWVTRERGDFDALIAVDAAGRFVLSSSAPRAPSGGVARLDWGARDFAAEPWFERALSGELVLIDHHRSPLMRGLASSEPRDPAAYHIGFAAPIRALDARGGVRGVLLGLVNWGRFQELILSASRREYFQGLIGSDLYSSSYAWLWGRDADTILAHPEREILGTRVSEPPVALPQLAAAARGSDWDMYPEYEFRGAWKNAAFKHCQGPAQGGFGWVVGIGINNEDIYATVNELRVLLIKATSVVLGLVLLWTFFVARRATRPIQELERHTRRVAAGDLDARLAVSSRDELGRLALAFNRMTEELRESRARLVRAEKEAAWREMARQVAHEIKNPLTPILLSVELLRRAREEGSPEFDRIFARTIDLVRRQVENMRGIAADFHAFAGKRKLEPQRCDLRASVDHVLALDAAWAAELGVAVEVEGAGVFVRADPEEVQRVLINLVSNALEAMPQGGRLCVAVREAEGRAEILVEDSGAGLSAEARERLFEPYFTTRSHGTGLGLAICKRVVDDLGGEIRLEPATPEGKGTRVRIRLPLWREEASSTS